MNNHTNYLMPFMWIRDGEHEQLISHIEDIQSMGQNALCVESRPHANFCKDEWWDDMTLILSECKKRNMDVWLLDDKYFPTGYVNGAIREKYPELHGRTMIERCLDVVGPINDAYFQIMFQHPSDQLIGVYAYPRDEKGNRVNGKPICLNDCVHGNRVYTSLPDGIWRICYFIHTEQFIDEDYINVVDEKACELLIKEVYEPHYERYKAYFGTTFKGFFSDEPSFHNNYYEKKLLKGNVYDRRIGDVGLALLYSDELLTLMREELGEDPVPYFYGLWYELDGESERIRHCYMNVATKLYRKNFSQKLGDWCRAHGVDYIGHVIEDNGCHARMTYGAGHYFRALSGQSMGGIDIVLHQVEPGFADHTQIISCGKFGNTEFFHYGLGKLASSISHIYPHMKNRAMCEVFGAYGWAESLPLMKWLCDFLFVRGINHFVPHAFSLRNVDPDSPPHFNAKGFPQKDGYRKLAEYMQRMSTALTSGTHICDAAILYHAELEWWNYDCMACETPGKQLYDNLMDYDFVDLDSLEHAKVIDHQLYLNKEIYPCLIIPEAKEYPPLVKQVLNRLSDDGLDIICINHCPTGVRARIITLDELANDMIAHGYQHINASYQNGLLRFYHLKQEQGDMFMLFNESVTESSVFTLETNGKYISSLDLLNQTYTTLPETNGMVTLTLEPYQSILLFCGEEKIFPTQVTPKLRKISVPFTWNISLYDTVEEKVTKEYQNISTLFNLNRYDQCPNFVGKATYTTEFTLTELPAHMQIRIHAEGQTVEVSVNGSKNELQICNPFIFDISDKVQLGTNKLEISLCNTLANKIDEKYTAYLPIYAGGLIETPDIYISEES
jgi:hypothetical protein